MTVSTLNLTYGTALANSQLSGTAMFTVNGTSTPVPGTYSWTSTSTGGTILKASSTPYSEKVTFTPTDTTDYVTLTNLSVTVNVAKATPNVTVNTVALTYGTALANSQLSGTATFIVNGGVIVSVPGTYTYTSKAGTVLAASASAYTEQVTFKPTDTIDYVTLTNLSVTVNVGQATPKVSVNPVKLTYGTALANSQLSGTATFIVNGTTVLVPGTYSCTSAAGTVLAASASAYTEAVTFTPNNTTDYVTQTDLSVMVAVAKATPKVTVSTLNLTYGTALANSQLSGTATFTVERHVNPRAGHVQLDKHKHRRHNPEGQFRAVLRESHFHADRHDRLRYADEPECDGQRGQSHAERDCQHGEPDLRHGPRQ